MTVYNQTRWPIEQIQTWQKLAETVNHWRGRNISIYSLPAALQTDGRDVVSIGVTFDGGMTVVSLDHRAEWTTALEYAARGKILVTH